MSDPSMRELMKISRWNQLIPKSAIALDIKDTYVRYLHPTKGWRTISKRRLGVDNVKTV